MKMRNFAGSCSLLAVALVCSPALAQKAPSQDSTVEDRLSPGGDAAQEDRRPGSESQGVRDRNIDRTPAENRNENRNQPADQENRERGERPDRSTQQQTFREEVQNRLDRSAVSDQILSDFLAGRLILMNQGIVQMSQMAEQRASSEEVKQFAQQLAESHTKLTHRLQKVSPQVTAIVAIDSEIKQRTAGYRGVLEGEKGEKQDQKADHKNHKDSKAGDREHKEHAKEDLKNERQESAHRDNSDPVVDRQQAVLDRLELKTDRLVQHRIAQGPLQQILEVEKNATQNYIVASTKMLEQYDGQDFDMGFLGFQIGSHTWAIAELQAMESHGDEEFQKLVGEVKSHMEKHLAQAKELSQKHQDKEGQSRQ